MSRVRDKVAEFAEHYSVAILPAGVRKSRDKSKVETGVHNRRSSRSPNSTPRSMSY